MKIDEFKKGVFFGIVLTISLAVIFNSGSIVYRRKIAKEKDYNGKAKEIYELLKSDYVEDIDKDKLFEGIYMGMLYDSTDRYSRYISKNDYESFKISTSGNYVGVGAVCSINADYRMYIKAVYDGSGADEAGLKENDEILKIYDTVVNYENYSEAIDLMRGKEGSTIQLYVYDPVSKVKKTVNVVRKRISVPTVAHTIIDDNIGYIKLSGFEGVTYDQYSKAYKELTDKNIKSLIIDLRDNPGGLVDSVSQIASDIIPKGIITYTEDKNNKKNYIYAKEGEINIPLVVLVNENSASAAELLSGAIQDTGKGTVIGRTTYGKGVVQTTYSMEDGSAVKITTAKYYTPKGICIDGIGIKPDIEVVNDKKYVLPTVTGEDITVDTINDAQLKKAIEVLNK